MNVPRPSHVLAIGLAAATLTFTDVAAQEPGSMQGVIRDGVTGLPLADVELAIGESKLRVRTDASGRYRFERVPPGPTQVRLQLDGYVTTVEQISVWPGWITDTDFTMPPVSVILERLLVRSGAPEELDPHVTRVAADNSPRSAAEALSKVPGVTILRPSGGIGKQTGIIVRGIKSFIGDGQPAIYLDGIRVADVSSSIGFGRHASYSSILDIIDTNSIDRIEVVKGSAGAARYGADTVDGVVLIYTKRGGEER